MNDTRERDDRLPCGHDRDNLVELDGQVQCYVCWAVDSGNYTFDTRTGPQVAHDEVSALAEKVRLLAGQVAEQGRLLHRLLNRGEL